MSVWNVYQMTYDGTETMITGVVEFEESGIGVWSIWVGKHGGGIALGGMTMA